MCARFRDPAAQNYAIGDFAKKAGVSTHFLKFYEEKGILHPRVQENGYRYYDIRDASLVLECFRMKNMGLSVRQIEKGINDCTEQEVAEMLQQRENVLQSQLHEQQMHLQGLQNLRVALRLCEQGEWSVRTVPDVWYLPHTIGKEFVQDSRIYDQLPQWLDWMPVVTSAQIVRGNDAHAERMEWGLGLEAGGSRTAGLCAAGTGPAAASGPCAGNLLLLGDPGRAWLREGLIPILYGARPGAEPRAGAGDVPSGVLLHRKRRHKAGAQCAAGAGEDGGVKYLTISHLFLWLDTDVESAYLLQ